MASPPFNINQAIPGDSDIVSQHPSNARTFRDVVESWLGINHDTNGYHFRVDIPRSASPTTPAAAVDVLYTTTTGRLKIKHPDGTEEYVGTPPGVVAWLAQVSAVPTVGWLYANGVAVSRATYADLYSIIGDAFGAGDGTTTFNLPDIKGRTIVGIDGGSGRISTATMSSTGLGGVGGSETSLLVVSNVPGGVSVTLTSVPVTIPSITVSGSISGTVGAQTSSGSISGTASGGSLSGTASGTVSGSASVTSTLSTFVKNAAGFNSQAIFGGGSEGIFSDVSALSIGGVASSGSISGSISGTSLSGSISGATLSGSYSGTVSVGSVSGSFSGTGTGSGTATGSGATTGSATAFTNMQPSITLVPIIKY